MNDRTNALRDDYRHVRFRCDETEPPQSFFVVTAHNPDGVTISTKENQRADQKLREKIKHLGFQSFPVVGGNADFTHAEPGYGITCSRREALILAHQFSQDAVFEVCDGTVFLISALDETATPEKIGSWRDLQDTEIP